MIRHLKARAPNIYIIVVAIAVSLWFEGVSTIIRTYVPKNNLQYGIMMCIVALAVFYLDDGSLKELHNYETPAPEKNRVPAFIAARHRD